MTDFTELSAVAMLPLGIVWHTVFFWVFAALTSGFAIAVVLEKNVVRMALYLIATLSATAALFMLAGAHFIGAMQIMIYVGGTLVLLIFGVMLTAQSAFVSMRTSGGEWVTGAILGGVLFAMLATNAISVKAWRTYYKEGTQVSVDAVETVAPIGLALVGIRTDARVESPSGPAAIQSGYLLPFEIISVHLLVVLIGAAYLARTKVQLPGRSA
ncbi:MAG: NADH-quinone oxidoreductase subunit J [Planctomycetota bacterium]|nr:NADH-quinone oxidoreductase subunit J [Planctomycetota bacterium]MDA1178452.1 NADH-quinone oxidoreductase subunit J [Planctomycetota bacterium]